jgi:hypothetical protein
VATPPCCFYPVCQLAAGARPARAPLHLWIGYAIAITLGVYVHMTMLFVVSGQFIVYLWERLAGTRENRRDMPLEFLAGFCFAGLLTFVLYAPVLPQLLGGTYLEGVQTTIEAWTNPLWTLLELVRGLQIGFAGTALGIIACLVFSPAWSGCPDGAGRCQADDRARTGHHRGHYRWDIRCSPGPSSSPSVSAC